MLGAEPSLLKDMIAAFGRPVVPEVNRSISMSVRIGPWRRESGGRVVGWDDIVDCSSVSVQERSVGVEDGSTKQIDRIPAESRESLTAWTLDAISESKMKSFASATVIQ